MTPPALQWASLEKDSRPQIWPVMQRKRFYSKNIPGPVHGAFITLKTIIRKIMTDRAV
jgi:hypothetical protein